VPNGDLLSKFSELIKKIWNPKNFQGHVSPHEVMQTISDVSKKRFKIGEQKDAAQLLPWMINQLSQDLKKAGSKVLDQALKGELEVTTLSPVENSSTFSSSVKPLPFYFLTVEMPENDLF
jgi:U4/U6.U5 tri-snRNP-associated protein 2